MSGCEIFEIGMLNREPSAVKQLSSDRCLRFRRVLFATSCPSDYEGELQTVFNFCQANGASLRIFHVYQRNLPPRGAANDVTPQDPVLVLRQMEDRAIELGLDCTSRLEFGVPAEKILQSIEEDKIDLVILGTSELRGLKRGTFGPTAERIMRESSCPIMTIGPVVTDFVPNHELKGPVVFATDFQSVTRHAIHVAISYCKKINLQLRCLHVLPPFLQSSHRDRALIEILSSALEALDDTSVVRIEKPVCDTIYGSEISNTVVDYVRQQRASLIFLGVPRDAAVSSDDPLPTVFRIIAEAPCPVVTILCDAHATQKFGSHQSKAAASQSYLQ